DEWNGSAAAQHEHRDRHASRDSSREDAQRRRYRQPLDLAGGSPESGTAAAIVGGEPAQAVPFSRGLMPHLRLQVPEEWLREEFTASTGFDAKKLLDHLVQVVAGLRMPNPALADAQASTDAQGKPVPPEVPFINLRNLKHGIEPLYYAHVAGE